ncbi:MAG: GxxExxY protein [Acidobacteria bacterium]|nr:GxxExxY protein [Acidobacteriota bacterium]
MDANEEVILKDEAYAIVGAAMEVHSQLGRGFLEAVYGDALAIELQTRGIPFQREVDIPISYKDQVLPKRYRADFIAFDQIILEVKAIKSLGDVERAQALNYLKATSRQLALLLNFGSAQLDWMRLVLTK